MFTEPSLADRLGAAGPDHVRKLYGLEAMVDRTETLYRKLRRERASD
jgi:hypothetical protein